MNATDVIGWTADADHWCSDCAEKTYGPDSETRKDSEGNDVHPIFASDETPQNTTCNKCGAEITEPCDCSEDYGPCEMHCTYLVTREGASLHTADELAALFVLDAQSVGATASPDDVALAESVDGWIDDDTGETQDHLQDIVQRVESTLPEGVQVYWNDGYVIVRVSPDSPLAQ